MYEARFLWLDFLLDGTLLQNAKKDLDKDQKMKMALRHGDNLKRLIQYLRYLFRGDAASSRNPKVNELKKMMKKGALSQVPRNKKQEQERRQQ